jgi:hypothetical protein
MGERLPRAAACLLALLAALLWLHQAVTMVKFKALKAAGYISPSLFWQDVQEHVGLGTADWGLALLLLLVALALLVLELRWLQLTHFYAYLIQSDRRALLFLMIFGIVCVRYYFAPGMYWGGRFGAFGLCAFGRAFAGGGRVAAVDELSRQRHPLFTVLRFSFFLLCRGARSSVP